MPDTDTTTIKVTLGDNCHSEAQGYHMPTGYFIVRKGEPTVMPADNLEACWLHAELIVEGYPRLHDMLPTPTTPPAEE